MGGFWYLFKDARVSLLGCKIAQEYSGYSSKAFSLELGAASLVKAIDLLNSETSMDRKDGAEILFIHLGEAARFRPVRDQNGWIQMW